MLFSSGRWDLNREPADGFAPLTDVGSLSNPHRDAWEFLWGDESPGVIPTCVGDFHWYPTIPLSPADTHRIRTMGDAVKPVFFSESGCGSMINPYRLTRLHEQDHTPADAEDYVVHRAVAASLTDDLKRYGMDGLFTFPEDLIRESERMHVRHRSIGYDAIRANPRFCGYSLTGIIDQPAGEGLLTEWRELKRGIMDGMTDCLSPLR